MEPSLEKPFLETDAEKIAEVARSHAETPEGKDLSGEQLTRKAIEISHPVATPTPAPADALSEPLPDYASSAPEDVKEKIESLLQTAASKGIAEAVSEAKKSSPFVLDAFHDALSAKLYPYLKEKGLLK